MSNPSVIDDPIQDAVPESFIMRSRARQEKLKQATAERKAKVNCDSDDNIETRKRQNLKYNVKELNETQTTHSPSRFSPSKTDTSKGKALKKSRSLPSLKLKPKQKHYPPSPAYLKSSESGDNAKAATGVNEGGKCCQVHLKKRSAIQRQTAPSPMIQLQEGATYDSIEEQLINIYGESMPGDIAYESASFDSSRSREPENPSILCRSRPKVQYEHFLLPTLPLLHRFTYSQINTLSRKQSELIKLYQSDSEATSLPVRRYAEELEPILRKKIGLLIVLYEAVRDAVSAGGQEELSDLACGDNTQKGWSESNSTSI